MVICLLTVSSPLSALDKVSLQLRWSHQFQFAGYYMALHKGYYQAAKIDVSLIEGGANSQAPLESILQGDADFAVSSSAVVIYHMQKKPVVALAAIMQTSPVTWITLSERKLSTPHDLIGRNLPILPPPESAALMAIFNREGIQLSDINFQPTRATLKDLISGKVDAINGYISNEPYRLKNMGYEVTLIEPKDYGVNFYSDVLITRHSLARSNPKLVKRFKQASLKGWQYALQNIDESIRLIQQYYAPEKTYQELKYEAQTLKALIMPDLVELGHMNPGRWQTIAENYRALGMAKGQLDLNGFLFDEPSRFDNWVIHVGIISAALIIMLSVIASRFIYLSTSLRREIKRREFVEKRLISVNNELKAQSSTDPLTQIYNRRAFFEKAQTLLHFSERKGFKTSLFMLDIDHFKRINDRFGHQAGDQILIQFCVLIKNEVIRDHDVFARLGGEEFCILMLDCSLSGAEQFAQRLIEKLSTTQLKVEGKGYITISASIGISDTDYGLEQALKQADIALYQAKDAGRATYTIYDANQS